MNTLIDIDNLNVEYEGKTVLKNVNLKVYENDFLGVIGPNGGGKTTLIKAILGLVKPASGRITLSSEVNTIGYLPQYNKIDKSFPISVEDVVLSGLNGTRRKWKKYNTKEREKAEEVIREMGMYDKKDKPIGELSGGEMQRALLGRAIISDPKILILDEPNTYIDKRYEGKLYQLLKEINKKRAIILVSHDIGMILQEVKSIACVNETLEYHEDTTLSGKWLEKNFECPIELLTHGEVPHRVLPHHGCKCK